MRIRIRPEVVDGEPLPLRWGPGQKEWRVGKRFSALCCHCPSCSLYRCWRCTAPPSRLRCSCWPWLAYSLKPTVFGIKLSGKRPDPVLLSTTRTLFTYIVYLKIYIRLIRMANVLYKIKAHWRGKRQGIREPGDRRQWHPLQGEDLHYLDIQYV